MTIFTLDRAAQATGIPIADLRGPSRTRHVCWTRFAIMEAMRARGMSTPAIGRLFHRDHTTIVSGLRQAEKLRGNPAFENIRSAIG
ncbi:helix-turn-helix domain-containing protein [Sphingobium chungbukense]|uniref:Chromosomal replication initiator DnaA C-terminal domain-containing protein n=1 Tax=Sphingobium chungbukense TaxID=56193 RepID=A0A0M3AVQ8_9SPHN|nr:helix-turn-helix domain-containing protein [Sphingobium chungbukense]KKW92664.1 hypothetical protein YP76_06940 [Sphingobium chungbukense]